jgi:hypothetical protein
MQKIVQLNLQQPRLLTSLAIQKWRHFYVTQYKNGQILESYSDIFVRMKAGVSPLPKHWGGIHPPAVDAPAL